jgi:hypothetical protein
LTGESSTGFNARDAGKIGEEVLIRLETGTDACLGG